MLMRTTAVLAIAVGLGCGSTAAMDAPPPPIDAGRDAPPPPPIGNTVELTAAGGRATGGSLTLDFQLGHSIDQGRASAGATALEGGAAVKP
jgi:hypothetical protein